MELQAYAKINLYLDVTAKRSDGYHDIISIMQTVDLCDDVSVICHWDQNTGIVLQCDNDLPCDRRNLAYRAAEAYFDGVVPCTVEIGIKKRIPMQAGLAGGSADCAAVLRALNLTFERYSEQELLALGARLGADVPFCLAQGTYITRGIGEVLEPCAVMPDCILVIARGGEGISTPWAYKALDTLYGDFSGRQAQSEQNLAVLLHAMQAENVRAMTDAMYNVFEEVVLPEHTVACTLKRDMMRNGAVGAMMSGSGPSVVGVFDDLSKAQAACDCIKEQGIIAYVCKPINP